MRSLLFAGLAVVVTVTAGSVLFNADPKGAVWGLLEVIAGVAVLASFVWLLVALVMLVARPG
jgi:hypothetical protein